MRLSPERRFEEATAVPVSVVASDGAPEASSARIFRGRRSMCIATEGSAGTWEILSSPRSIGGVWVAACHNTPAPRLRAGNRVGAKPRRNRGTAKRRKRSAAGGMAGSLSVLVVPVKQGE
jgi:hypothetical protein